MPDTTPTVLGPDTHIKGEMSFAGSARLLGSFEGSISSKGELHVGDSATCKASLEAARIVVDGSIEGDITAHERVDLNASARVKGDILAHSLVVADGASFVGHCKVGPDALAQPRPASGSAGAMNLPAARGGGVAGVQTRPVRPTAPVLSEKTDRLSRAAAELQNDPEWQQLASA